MWLFVLFVLCVLCVLWGFEMAVLTFYVVLVLFMLFLCCLCCVCLGKKFNSIGVRSGTPITQKLSASAASLLMTGFATVRYVLFSLHLLVALVVQFVQFGAVIQTVIAHAWGIDQHSWNDRVGSFLGLVLIQTSVFHMLWV